MSHLQRTPCFLSISSHIGSKQSASLWDLVLPAENLGRITRSCALLTPPLFTDFAPKLLGRIYSGWIWSGLQTLFFGRLLEHAQSCHHKAIQIRSVRVPRVWKTFELKRMEERKKGFKTLSMCSPSFTFYIWCLRGRICLLLVPGCQNCWWSAPLHAPSPRRRILGDNMRWHAITMLKSLNRKRRSRKHGCQEIDKMTDARKDVKKCDDHRWFLKMYQLWQRQPKLPKVTASGLRSHAVLKNSEPCPCRPGIRSWQKLSGPGA